MKKGIYSLLILLLIPCIFVVKSNAQEVQTGNEYNIVIVEDGEEVPLAAEMSVQPVVLSVVGPFVFVIIVLLLVVLTYIIQCYKYRERIRMLFQKNSNAKKLGLTMNWNLFHLKDLENELENYLVSSIHSDK